MNVALAGFLGGCLRVTYVMGRLLRLGAGVRGCPGPAAYPLVVPSEETRYGFEDQRDRCEALPISTASVTLMFGLPPPL